MDDTLETEEALHSCANRPIADLEHLRLRGQGTGRDMHIQANSATSRLQETSEICSGYDHIGRSDSADEKAKHNIPSPSFLSNNRNA